jgi:hypothetical protein
LISNDNNLGSHWFIAFNARNVFFLFGPHVDTHTRRKTSISIIVKLKFLIVAVILGNHRIDQLELSLKATIFNEVFFGLSKSISNKCQNMLKRKLFKQKETVKFSSLD